jgi:hypothetical protein
MAARGVKSDYGISGVGSVPEIEACSVVFRRAAAVPAELSWQENARAESSIA